MTIEEFLGWVVLAGKFYVAYCVVTGVGGLAFCLWAWRRMARMSNARKGLRL